jgi:hypothetical protein
MAMSVERTKALRKTRAPRTSEIHDWRERGRSPRDCGRGYEGATSADQDERAQAVNLFVTDVLASIGRGNVVTTCNSVSRHHHCNAVSVLRKGPPPCGSLAVKVVPASFERGGARRCSASLHIGS